MFVGKARSLSQSGVPERFCFIDGSQQFLHYWDLSYKNFTAIIYRFSLKLEFLSLSSLVQYQWVRPRAYPRVEYLKGAALLTVLNNFCTRGNSYKKFMGVIYGFLNKLECLSLVSHSTLVKCLQVRPGAYPRVEHLRGAALLTVLNNFCTWGPIL